MSDQFGEKERVPRSGQPEKPDEQTIQRIATRVADELKSAQNEGRAVGSLHRLIRTPQTDPTPEEDKYAWSLVMPVTERLQKMAKDGDKDLDRALVALRGSSEGSASRSLSKLKELQRKLPPDPLAEKE